MSIIITGCTGFLGKVVLEELLRSYDHLNVADIKVLVRPAASKTAQERFCDEIASSLCFSRLEESWTSRVQVVECDLSQPGCGIQDTVYTQICEDTTHIIHCAGSVTFSSATHELVSDNIISALNLLELARKCQGLQRLVSTSTAFVSPPTSDPIDECLLPLPLPAQEICDMLQDGKSNSKDILQITSHPNLYTLTKCLGEHLLIERRGNVPLAIVRPSIISASARYPFPGWVDSFAALAGLVASVGTGVLRVLKADAEVIMDVVPVDDVARRLIEETMSTKTDREDVQIIHVVSTVRNGIRIASARRIVLGYFAKIHILFKPRVRLVNNRSFFRFRIHDTLNHRLPRGMAKLLGTICGDTKELRRIERARKAQVDANSMFEVFTHNTYDFRCRHRSLNQQFNSDAYVLQICQGVQEYLLRQSRS